MSPCCGRGFSATLTRRSDVSENLLLREGVRHDPSGPFDFPGNTLLRRSDETADFEVIVKS